MKGNDRMAIYNKKLLHDSRLYALEGVSMELGRRVMRELAQRGSVVPEHSASGRVSVSMSEAERFHNALVPPLSCWMRD